MGFNIAWLQKKVKIGKNDKMLKNTMVFKCIWRFTEKTIGGKMKENSVKKECQEKR